MHEHTEDEPPEHYRLLGQRLERLCRQLNLLQEAQDESDSLHSKSVLRNRMLDLHAKIDRLEAELENSSPQSSPASAIGPGPAHKPPDQHAPAWGAATPPARSDISEAPRSRLLLPGYYDDPFTPPHEFQRAFDGVKWGDDTHPVGGPTLRQLQVSSIELLPEPASFVPTGATGYYEDPFTEQGFQRFFNGERWRDSTYPEGGHSLSELSNWRIHSAGPGGPQAPPGLYPDPHSAVNQLRGWRGGRWDRAPHRPANEPYLPSYDCSLHTPELAFWRGPGRAVKNRTNDERRFAAPRSVHSQSIAPRTSAGGADRPINRLALTGFIFGVVSIFLYEVGILPIAAVILSAFGLGTFKAEEHSGRWMGIGGLVLGCLYTLMYLISYGHIGA